MKARLKGAQKGHSLLKKKADALNLRFREILRKIVEVNFKVSHIMDLLKDFFLFKTVNLQNWKDSFSLPCQLLTSVSSKRYCSEVMS